MNQGPDEQATVSEPVAAHEAAPVPGIPPVSDPALNGFEQVSREIRGLRRWLIGLTIVVLILPVMSCGGCYALSMGFPFLLEGGPSVESQQLDAAKEQVEDVWGDRLESIDVRAIKVTYEDFGPFGFLPELGGEEVTLVEYQVKGVDTTFSGVLEFDAMPADVGLLPQRGTLSSQMNDDEVIALARAFAQESEQPIGGMMSYFEVVSSEMGPSSQTSVTIGGDSYALQSLWAVREAVEVKNDTIDGDILYGARGTTLVVFARLDDGTYRYVGTESRPMWDMMGIE